MKVHQIIQEKLITFGGQAYPKFGNVCIMAGGAGSGKGFVLENLIGMEGKVLDVDALKGMVIASKQLSARIEQETGQNISDLNLRNPKDVGMIHSLLSDVYDIIGKNERMVFKSITTADPERKPNLIFDVTLKDEGKMSKIADACTRMGYAKENIHLVWVVNDVKLAIKQNQARDRVIPTEILIDTHRGAAETMSTLLRSNSKLRSYMDGDAWLAFNQKGVDSDLELSSDKDGNAVEVDGKRTAGSTGSYVSKADTVQVKEKGQAVKTTEQIGTELAHGLKIKGQGAGEYVGRQVTDKIRQYAPAKADTSFKRMGEE